jgi:hypothetical protein
MANKGGLRLGDVEWRILREAWWAYGVCTAWDRIIREIYGAQYYPRAVAGLLHLGVTRGIWSEYAQFLRREGVLVPVPTRLFREKDPRVWCLGWRVYDPGAPPPHLWHDVCTRVETLFSEHPLPKEIANYYHLHCRLVERERDDFPSLAVAVMLLRDMEIYDGAGIEETLQEPPWHTLLAPIRESKPTGLSLRGIVRALLGETQRPHSTPRPQPTPRRAARGLQALVRDILEDRPCPDRRLAGLSEESRADPEDALDDPAEHEFLSKKLRALLLEDTYLAGEDEDPRDSGSMPRPATNERRAGCYYEFRRPTS